MQNKTNTILLIVLIILVAMGVWFFAQNNGIKIDTDKKPMVEEKEKPPVVKKDENKSGFVDVGCFTVSLPETWVFNKLSSVDSCVGEFVGDGAKLTFDLGWYSNDLASYGGSQYLVTYEIIDGKQAKVVTSKIAGTGITGVYFSNFGNNTQNRLNIIGTNLTFAQQNIVMGIFRSAQSK